MYAKEKALWCWAWCAIKLWVAEDREQNLDYANLQSSISYIAACFYGLRNEASSLSAMEGVDCLVVETV